MIKARAPALASASRKRARSGIRRLTCSLRALPDFLVIGTQKASTTSLYRYLWAHPDVLLAARKEAYYFDRHFREGEAWYRSDFPLRTDLSALQGRQGRRPTVGEASPSCMPHPPVGERVRALLPDARLLGTDLGWQY